MCRQLSDNSFGSGQGWCSECTWVYRVEVAGSLRWARESWSEHVTASWGVTRNGGHPGIEVAIAWQKKVERRKTKQGKQAAACSMYPCSWCRGRAAQQADADPPQSI